MKSLRHLIVPAALAAAMALPAGAFAQQAAPAPAAAPAAGAHHWHGHHHHRHGMFRKLNLSAQQHAQIKQIMQQFRQAHPRGSKPDPQARKQLRAQIMNVLTPQQRTELQQHMQQMRERRAQRRSGTPMPASTPQP